MTFALFYLVFSYGVGMQAHRSGESIGDSILCMFIWPIAAGMTLGKFMDKVLDE